MNGLFLGYRDPLFGIITLVAFVFAISFITYSFSLYKEKIARREYRKLLKRFELGNLKEDDYVHLYATYNLPFDSIVLLASTFLYKGEYNKAISVYQALLEHVNDKVKKEELLELLGKTYFKGGFLQRAKDIYLQVLKFSPRNEEVLTYLLYTYEKLKELENAKEVLNSLEELGQDIKLEKAYIDTLGVIYNPILSFEKKTKKLFELFKENNSIERLLVGFLLRFNKEEFWENLKLFDLSKHLDLLWFLDFNDVDFDYVSESKLLSELYTAKAYINAKEQSDNFVLDVLIALRKNKSKAKADLNFEFICQKCKKVFPMYNTRCPQCHSILSSKVQAVLTRSSLEKNQSLQ